MNENLSDGDAQAPLAALNLSGATAVISGAASGIGRASAELLALRGAHVVIADVNEDLARIWVEQSPVAERMQVARVDVANEAEVSRFVASVAGSRGSIDILVNCAGVQVSAAVEEMSEYRRGGCQPCFDRGVTWRPQSVGVLSIERRDRSFLQSRRCGAGWTGYSS